MSPESTSYTKYVGGTEIAWNALGLAASGMQLPPALASAIPAIKTAYFEPQYLPARSFADGDRGREARTQREPMDPAHGGRLGAAVKVAEAALDAAKGTRRRSIPPRGAR